MSYNQTTLFDPPEIRTRDGRRIDARIGTGIDAARLYRTDEAAELMYLSQSTIRDMCHPSRCRLRSKSLDPRWQELIGQKHYSAHAFARLMSCSHTHILNLMRTGELKHVRPRIEPRIPDWAFADLIQHNASHCAEPGELDFLKLGALTRIAGWSMLDQIRRHSSEL